MALQSNTTGKRGDATETTPAVVKEAATSAANTLDAMPYTSTPRSSRSGSNGRSAESSANNYLSPRPSAAGLSPNRQTDSLNPKMLFAETVQLKHSHTSCAAGSQTTNDILIQLPSNNGAGDSTHGNGASTFTFSMTVRTSPSNAVGQNEGTDGSISIQTLHNSNSSSGVKGQQLRGSVLPDALELQQQQQQGNSLGMRRPKSPSEINTARSNTVEIQVSRSRDSSTNGTSEMTIQVNQMNAESASQMTISTSHSSLGQMASPTPLAIKNCPELRQVDTGALPSLSPDDRRESAKTHEAVLHRKTGPTITISPVESSRENSESERERAELGGSNHRLAGSQTRPARNTEFVTAKYDKERPSNSKAPVWSQQIVKDCAEVLALLPSPSKTTNGLQSMYSPGKATAEQQTVASVTQMEPQSLKANGMQSGSTSPSVASQAVKLRQTLASITQSRAVSRKSPAAPASLHVKLTGQRRTNGAAEPRPASTAVDDGRDKAALQTGSCPLTPKINRFRNVCTSRGPRQSSKLPQGEDCRCSEKRHRGLASVKAISEIPQGHNEKSRQLRTTLLAGAKTDAANAAAGSGNAKPQKKLASASKLEKNVLKLTVKNNFVKT